MSGKGSMVMDVAVALINVNTVLRRHGLEPLQSISITRRTWDALRRDERFLQAVEPDPQRGRAAIAGIPVHRT